jgi:SAM-dependent methyltransferase
VDEAPDYAFPHAADEEARRLELLQQRLDPLTIHRFERLGVGGGARCLELGGGRGSITSWLADRVGAAGHVTATDLQVESLQTLELPNVEVVRHDIRSDTFPEGSFDFVHARAVLMHVPADGELLARMVSWLRPDGWLLLEEPDFGMWLGDADPVWALGPKAWHGAFPEGSLSRGRWLLHELPRCGLADVAAEAEIDVIRPGTPLAEFHRLSEKAIAPAAVAAGALTAEQAAALQKRPTEPDFLACGFVHVGAWGRKPA